MITKTMENETLNKREDYPGALCIIFEIISKSKFISKR